MNRLHSLVLAALVSSTTLLNAQTGPTGPSGPGPGNTAPGMTQNFSPDRLANYLKAQGHQVDVKRHNNGAVTVLAQIQKDGWRYSLEVEYTIDQKTMNFVCPLGNPGANFSAAQLLSLLKTTYGLNPVHFSYRESDQRLCLEDPIYNATVMNETQFQNILDRLLKIVRDTHPQWDSSRWPTNEKAPVGGVNPPVASPITPPPATVQQGLANSTWVGSETLGGYGKLEFRFEGNGLVTMIDKDGANQGTYSVNGSSVTLTFYNGTVIYSGSMSGQTISGNASNGKVDWNFTISR